MKTLTLMQPHTVGERPRFTSKRQQNMYPAIVGVSSIDVLVLLNHSRTVLLLGNLREGMWGEGCEEGTRYSKVG